MARKSTKTEETVINEVEEIREEVVQEEQDEKVEEIAVKEETKEEQKVDKEKELEDKNRQLEEQLKQMQSMIMQMQSNQNAIMGNALASNQVNSSEKNVYIQSYNWNAISMRNTTGTTGLSFTKVDEITAVKYNMLSSFLTEEVKGFFENGILAFVNGSENCYDDFYIRRPQHYINKEFIKEIYSKPRKEAIDILNEVTNNKRNDIVLLNIFWTSIRMLVNNELDMFANQIVSGYFGIDVQNAMNQFIFMREKGYVK